MIARDIDLDTDFTHYDEPERALCIELQAKARELLPQFANKHPDRLLNAAAEALAPGGGQERYSGIYACETCGQLYHGDYSTNSDPRHDYCSGECQPSRRRKELHP